MIHQNRDWKNPVSVYICPLRRAALAFTVVEEDDWGRYNGGGWTWGKTDYATNMLTIFNRPYCRTINEISDGMANTILVGEKAFNPRVETQQSWYWDEPFFLGGSKGTQREGLAILTDSRGDWQEDPYKNNWGSPHTSGAHFLFGDGAVRMLSRGMDSDTLHKLLTPDGNELVNVP